MLISEEKLKYLLDTAKERKDEIKPIYNRVLNLVDPFVNIKDEGKKTLETQRKIDSTVVDAIDALVSFIMSSILTRSGKWADIMIDESRLLEQEGEQISGEIEEAKKVIDDDTDKVFRYIQSSNYYTEIAKSVNSFVKTGTGVYFTRATGSTSKPFIYSYVGLDNLYILEDSFSNPNIVFKLHPEVNAEYLFDIFGRDITLPSELSEEDFKKNINVYECVIPTYDEVTTLTKYNYIVVTEDLKNIIVERELEYNPFVVFRWDILEGNPWGKSIVLQNVDLLEELETYKELFKKQAKRIASPPATFFGNQELFNNLSLEEGKINFGGDPMMEGSQGQMQIMNGGQNLMPLDKLIDTARSQFRSSLMVDNLVMNVEQGKGTTATYVSYMQEMFRKRFANTYELINSELLEPTFMNPFIIMMEYDMLNVSKDIIPFTTLTYTNQLSKATDMGDVNNLVNYTSVMANINQAGQMGVILDIPKTTAYITNKMDIPKDLVPSEEDLQQIQDAKMKQAQQMQEMAQQMGGVQSEGQGEI